MKTKSNLYRKEKYFGYLFILPPVVGFLLFTLYPALYSVYGSFTDWNGLGQMNFIGLDNFKDILTDDFFYKSMFNTLFLMIGIPIGLVISLLLALGLNRKIPGTTTFRVIYYVPVISSLAAISILWQWAYNGDYGLVNQFLDLFGIKGPNWLANTTTVKPALIIMTIWKGLGYSMLLYLAALQSVSRSYYEAAELDGASGFKMFRHITWPMVKPVTFFLVVTNIIGGSQIFTEINIMTPTGGPEYSSATIVFYIWQKAFDNLQMGYASAMAVILGLFIFIVTLIQFKMNERSSFDVD
ncbi:sugar ABC transporter permease [Paenibacillus sp. PsM32]|uniref:Carbohydrate ABC transporter permease n=2 Tax=Paenibacillus TaxID=44249 RepID=A0ABW4UZ64_9BACL|nr:MULTISPECIES: sugar ABC transporter permease [Paenibacillus]MDN4617133.1 sugar ABC transporter permease [Paenibacillus sp. PsM32]MDQ1233021.1 multiple sugar transport system permease protein [Paenibacillus sp. SORGH_AS_0306]MDR6110065.1 multiple sugar transport system permease protein [Paenibacillus sp. SORGH_AS_0338]WCT57040.1 sugar ABC transporter permease [Paenibacillus kyungheensis]WDF49865.1 sugar ABC transporter permease [Paenibacillus sp. KACC 21273]